MENNNETSLSNPINCNAETKLKTTIINNNLAEERPVNSLK